MIGIGCYIFFTFFEMKNLVREPVVAGMFYPEEEGELRKMVHDFFEKNDSVVAEKDLQAIILPHAGYVYSGDVAAAGVRKIDPQREFENIFLIGASHRVSFEGASIYTKGNYQTPMGEVEVDVETGRQLISENNCFEYFSAAHADEHCLEVQLPFLQFHLKKNFRIVPIVLGTHSWQVCSEVAKGLKPFFNSKNLFVISTDFSHYPDYDNAYVVDSETAGVILKNSALELREYLESKKRIQVGNLQTRLCGWTAVLTLLYLSGEDKSFSYELVKYQNSGDISAGGRKRVVGYYSIALRRFGMEAFTLSNDEKVFLLNLAKERVNWAIRAEEDHIMEEVEKVSLPNGLMRCAGAFVSLYIGNDLRGCIGHIGFDQPLYKVVDEMAMAAALKDLRFDQIMKNELSKLKIEISVLTPLVRVYSVNEIVPGKHGIYMKKEGHSGTFLPQVAKKTGWTAEEMLGYCARDKANVGWNGWRDAELYVYEAVVFDD